MRLPHRSRWARRLCTPLVMWLGLGIVGALLTLSPAGLASDVPDLVPAWPETKPPKREWRDGPIKDYLHHLQRPDNGKHPERDKYARSCCDAGDTVKTKFMVEPGGGRRPDDRWYAWLSGIAGLLSIEHVAKTTVNSKELRFPQLANSP